MTALRLLLLCLICFALGALFVTVVQRLQSHMRRVSRASEAPPLDARLHAGRQSQFALLNSGDRIVMVGDSRIDEGEWEDLLGRTDIANRGISGDTTAGLLARFSETFTWEADVCVIQIGINDLMQGSAVERVERNFRRILQQLTESKRARRIVLTSVLLTGEKSRELNTRVQELNVRLKRLAEETGVTWLDVNQLLGPAGHLEAKYTNDGTHLTGEGYRIFASALKPFLDADTAAEP
jgi:lysophospholipase L1-like esterase